MTRRHRLESTRVDRRDKRLVNVLAGCAIVGSFVAVTALAAWAMDNQGEHDTNGGVYDSVVPCATEDSTGCFWDASEQGNGQGHDVLNPPAPAPIILPVADVSPAPAPAESTQVDQPPVVTEQPTEQPAGSCVPGDAEVACGPVTAYDEGMLICGTDAAPAIDQDTHGNWWAYCEPAMVNDDGTLWTDGN